MMAKRINIKEEKRNPKSVLVFIFLNIFIPAIVAISATYFSINSFILQQPKIYISSESFLYNYSTEPHFQVEIDNIGAKTIHNVRLDYKLEEETEWSTLFLPKKSIKVGESEVIKIIPKSLKNIKIYRLVTDAKLNITPPLPSPDNLTVCFNMGLLKQTRLIIKINSDEYNDKKDIQIPYPQIMKFCLTYTEKGAEKARTIGPSPVGIYLINYGIDEEGKRGFSDVEISTDEVEYANIIS
jgi:hypothetical protein